MNRKTMNRLLSLGVVLTTLLSLWSVSLISASEPAVDGAWVEDWEGDLGPHVGVCLFEPQWFTVEGQVTLTPPGSKAYLQTTWRVAEPGDPDCPPGDDCAAEHYTTEKITSDPETGEYHFTITGWWPGIRAGDEVVEIHFGVNVLDQHRNPIHHGIGKDVYWNRWVCEQPTPA